MRFQSLEILDYDTLRKFSEKLQSPRVVRAVERFIDLFGEEFET